MTTWVQCKNGQSVRLPHKGWCIQRITTINCSAVEPNRCRPASISIRRQALSGAIALGTTTLLTFSATATGLEAIDLPGSSLRTVNEAKMQENRDKLSAAEDSFRQSPLLNELKARTEANRESRAKELRDKYCMRQAELGVGDCAGLRLIPGATKTGVQKRPDWMESMSSMFGTDPEESGNRAEE